mgnify:CR=1 FL=1
MTRHATLSAALSAAIAFTALAGPAQAKEETLRHVRLCDTSYCYYAWNVVDSDGDGVSDADERVAGFDPHDPSSRPPLPLMVEMIGKQYLPTFEYGVGMMVVRPADLEAQLAKFGLDMPDSPLA